MTATISKTKKILRVENLSVEFETLNYPVHAVRGVSFELREGETIGIVGESGCGKSVTLQALLQLINAHSGVKTSGKAHFQDRDLLELTKKELERIRGREIGFIFQDPFSSLNPTMKVGAQIMEAIVAHRILPPHLAKKRTLDLLKMVGLQDLEVRFNQYPHELSGGIRQRVMIALAISCNPKVLIADEPTTALDVTIQAQILELLQELKQKIHISILLITHDLGVVANLCDRVLVMYTGKIVESGTVEDVLLSPQHPYTKMLLKSVPRLDNSSERLQEIKGSPPTLSHSFQGCSFAERCPFTMNICMKKPPTDFQVKTSQTAACWLHDPRFKGETS